MFLWPAETFLRMLISLRTLRSQSAVHELGPHEGSLPCARAPSPPCQSRVSIGTRAAQQLTVRNFLFRTLQA